jgi:hypothetical protein
MLATQYDPWLSASKLFLLGGVVGHIALAYGIITATLVLVLLAVLPWPTVAISVGLGLQPPLLLLVRWYWLAYVGASLAWYWNV